MNSDLNYSGIWFLPNDKENKLNGVLSSVDEKFSLSTKGSFESFDNEFKEYEIILGLTDNGKKITLVNCFQTNKSRGFPGIASSKYFIVYVFENNHFNSIDEIIFDKCIFSTKYLEKWINIDGFERYDFEKKEFNINYKTPKNIEFSINEDIKAQINFYYLLSSKSIYERVLKQKSDVEFTYNIKKPFLDILSDIITFKGFISFSTFNICSFKTINFTSKKEGNIVFRFFEKNKFTIDEDKSFHSFMFNYKNIESNFEEIINKWFEVDKNNSILTNTILNEIADDKIFVENRFLNLSQTMEVFHRTNNQNTEDLKFEFEKKLNKILEKLKEDEQKWLKEKLIFSYEPSLRKRIKNLLNEHNLEVIKLLFPSRKRTNSFVNKVVNSRNYYTHYNKKLKESALNPSDLNRLSDKIKIFLIVILLKKIGINDNQINEMNFFKYNFRHILE